MRRDTISAWEAEIGICQPAKARQGRAIGQSRVHYQEPQTPADSPFRKFIVHCFKCGSYQLRIASTYDEDAGEHRVTLVCIKCRQAEEIRLT